MILNDEIIGSDVGRRERMREENADSHNRDLLCEKFKDKAACVMPMTCIQVFL